MSLAEVMRIYEGSDGRATKALFDRLEPHGPAGKIAVNLFRACKNSARAKVYRGRQYTGAAYDTKQWAMGNLVQLLLAHGEPCGIAWGWGQDEKALMYRWVLYVDLPTGQVSFHTGERGAGPDYAGKWDGIVDASHGRICSWIARLLAETVPA